MKYLCALEAVNLNSLFADCNDLSTVRGGGLAVLKIANLVAEGLRPTVEGDDIISQGASQGILRVEGKSPADVEARVRNILAGQSVLPHTTIMVAVCPDEGDEAFARQRAWLKNKMRWDQMQAPSVVYPPLSGTGVCGIDKVRPATHGDQSAFTAQRKELGRKKKRDLIQDLLREPAAGITVANDLAALAARQEGNLQGKIAVFRFDGNDFGKKAHDCKTASRFQDFSATVQRQQEDFFRSLLLDQQGQFRPGWLSRDGELRLEIVVYGGDEVSFITPAELGWQTLDHFLAQDWGENTYAGGLVFCHAKAPIHTIKKLAGALTDWAKKQPDDRQRNSAGYLILESYDDIGRDMDDFMDDRYEHLSGGVALTGAVVHPMQENMDRWRSHISKRKLHDVAHAVLQGATPDFDEAMKDLLEAKSSLATGVTEQIRAAFDKTGRALFVHMLELWDYAAADRQ